MKHRCACGFVLALVFGGVFGAELTEKYYKGAHERIAAISRVQAIEISKGPELAAKQLTEFLCANSIFDPEDDYKKEFTKFIEKTIQSSAEKQDLGRRILRAAGTYRALAESLWGLDTHRFNGVVTECDRFFDTPLGISLVLGKTMILSGTSSTPAYIGKYFSFGDFFKEITDKIASGEKNAFCRYFAKAVKTVDADRWAFYHHMVPLEHRTQSFQNKRKVFVIDALSNGMQAAQKSLVVRAVEAMPLDKHTPAFAAVCKKLSSGMDGVDTSRMLHELAKLPPDKYTLEFAATCRGLFVGVPCKKHQIIGAVAEVSSDGYTPSFVATCNQLGAGLDGLKKFWVIRVVGPLPVDKHSFLIGAYNSLSTGMDQNTKIGLIGTLVDLLGLEGAQAIIADCNRLYGGKKGPEKFALIRDHARSLASKGA